MSPQTRTQLSPVEVEAIMVARVSVKPMSTVDIADLCAAAYPHWPGITVKAVKFHLRYLERRDRVTGIRGAEKDSLAAQGVFEPDAQLTYWVYRGLSAR